MDAFNINVQKKDYNVTSYEDKDQILYEVSDNDKLICLIGLNEEGAWEANNETPQELVQQFGDAIEQYTA